MSSSRIAHGLAVAALALATSAAAAPQISLQASRTSGVAPLAVHFDATATTATGANAFHDLLYSWTFGDSAAGTWTYSGLSKDKAFGPLAAHVFETPGSYTVTLSVRDPSGQSSSVTRAISVADPNTVFSGGSTVCASTSGTFTGCPTGAQQVTASTFNAAMGNAGTGKRVLLRRGETFPSASSVTVNQAGPATVGAFGTGAAPRVTVSHTGGAIKTSGNPDNFDDWRFMDLALEGPGAGQAFLSNGSTHRLLLLRVGTVRFATGVLMNHKIAASYNQPLHYEIYLAECSIMQMQGGAGGNGLYMSVNRIVLLGNHFEDSTQAEHVVRLPHFSYGVISHNYLARSAAAKHLLKLHAIGETETYSFPERRSHDFVVSDNTFVGDTNQSNMNVGPQDSTQDERVYQGLVERNFFRAGVNGVTELKIWASDVSIRNNVFDLTRAQGGNAVDVERRGIEPLPVNDRADNNTCFTGTGAVDCVDIKAGTGHVAFNNLAVGGTGTVAASGGQTNSGNVVLSTSPWVSANPNTFADYRLDPLKAKALVDRGTTLTLAAVDPMGVVQPADGNSDGVVEWDVGAFEIGTPASGGGGNPPPPAAPAAPVLLP